jgi:hypothetical protein
MTKFIAILVGVAALVITAPAAADPPTPVPFEFVFEDVNPCTGLTHTVTIAGTTHIHEHDGRVVATSERTITTSPTGFVGHGTDRYVLTDRVETFSLRDILMSPSGDRIRVGYLIVVDLGAGTVRVEGGAFTCLGPA